MTAPVAVLWDVGNVIVRWDPRTLFTKIFKEPADLDRFLSFVCTPEWHVAHDRGVSFADNAAPLIAAHPEHEPHIRAWGERFQEMLSGSIPETVEAIQALHDRGVRQFALTNMPQSKWAGVKAMSSIFDLFEGEVVSGEVGVIKPDPAIFRIVEQRFGLACEQMLFIDDSAANIEAAARLGFHVHRFDDPAALRPALERCGLL